MDKEEDAPGLSALNRPMANIARPAFFVTCGLGALWPMEACYELLSGFFSCDEDWVPPAEETVWIGGPWTNEFHCPPPTLVEMHL